MSKLESDRERALRRAADADDDGLADTYAEAARRLRGDIASAKTRLEEARADVAPPLVPQVDEASVSRHLRGVLDGLGADLGAYSGLVDQLREHHQLRVVVLKRHLARIQMDLDPSLFRSQPGSRLRVVQRGDTRLPYRLEVKVGEPRQTVDEWVEENQNNHICACGCGETIEIKPIHRAPTKGIPKFIHGHHRMNMTEFVETMNAGGLLTVSQAASEVGVSENTLRRAESKGWVTPERRTWGDRPPMRLYRKDDLPGLRETLRENGFRFSDEETFTTADVAKMLGVSENTVRRWEREGKLPTVQRDTNGRRLYRKDEVEAILS